MLETDWYCAKCTRFIDTCQAHCDACGRLRGSFRSREAHLAESGLYPLRLLAAKTAEAPPAP